MEATWDKVEVAVEMARGIAFDGCHKIYVLMDEGQMAEMKGYGYDPLFSSDDLSPAEMLETIHTWWNASCGLRFVSGIRTVDSNPNDGFITLIPQGAEFEAEEPYI